MLKRAFFNESELRAGWRFALYILLVVACGAGLYVVLHFLLHAHAKTGATVLTALRTLVNEVFLVFIFIVPALIMGRFERRTLGDYGLPARGAFGRRFGEGILWGFGLQCAAILLLMAFGVCHISGFAENAANALKYGALWAVAFILVGIAEEFSFRGYSQFTLTTGMGFWPAAILLSAAFALLHLNNKGETWMGAVGVFFAAMILVLPLQRTGALWFSIGLHAGFDWTETYFFGVADSGMQAHGYLLNTSFSGSKWLTGGTVGPEASVVTLALLALTFVLLHIRFPNVQYPRPGALHAPPPPPPPAPETTPLAP
jgi:membrane protease YdiL (CAAX protease family)